MKKIFYSCFILFLLTEIATAQNSISLKIITLTAHPWAKENIALHENNIDKLGYITAEPGLILSFENFFTKSTSIRFSVAAMNDRFNTLSGFAQVAIKYKAVKYYKHSFSIGIGPTLHYSAYKTLLPQYINDEKYSEKESGYYRISWISGLAEYNYAINKNTEFALALNHPHPKSIGLSIGLRFRLPDPNGKGCDCPGYR